MKKIIALMLIAVTALSSCEKNEKTEKTDSYISDSFGDVSVNEIPETSDYKEPETAAMQMFTDSDFRDVNLKVDIEEAEGLIEVNDIDLSAERTAERRTSPCKAEGVCDKFRNLSDFHYPVLELTDMYEDEETAIARLHDELMQTPRPAKIKCMRFTGDKVYYVSDFDMFCKSPSHEISIYSYDVQTEEIKEIYNHSSLDSGIYINDLIIKRDRLFAYISETFLTDEEIYSDNYLAEIDLENGTLKKIYEGSLITNDTPDDRLVISCQNKNTTALKEFDFETEELKDIFECTDTEDIFINDNIITVAEKNDKRNLIVKSDKYELQTELRGDVVGVDENKIYIMCKNKIGGSTTGCMYIYDFDNMERCICDFSQFGGEIVYRAGKNFIVTQGAFSYYFIPEIAKAVYLWVHFSDAYTYCNGFVSTSITDSGDDFTYDYDTGYYFLNEWEFPAIIRIIKER